MNLPTVSLLPLYEGARECVRSGYCCKQAPCPFGTWNEEKHQCTHLVKGEDGRYECGIIEEIVTKPGWQFSPAFGAGCCSPMNTDRQKILRDRHDRTKSGG